jgi:hypothetical protein
MKRRCLHRKLAVRTESDGCSWVQCACGFRGPRKHSYGLALIAWVVKLSSDHPQRRAAARAVRS